MLRLTRPLQRQLAGLVDFNVRQTLLGEKRVPGAANLLEAIGATVSSALPACGDAWQKVLRPLGVRIDVVGAFSFGCPKVDFLDGDQARRCDLGSLLAVVDDLRGSVVDRRAVLLSMQLRGREVNVVQRQLYAEWPVFQLADDAYGAAKRDLRGAIDEPPGRFAEIDLGGREPKWTLFAHSGAFRTEAHSSIGDFLAAMAVGRAGRVALIDGPDPWSQIVRELLNRTARAAVGGLGPQAEARSATTYEGKSGSGLVVLENREGLPLKSALAVAAERGMELQEGPISVAHVMFRRD